MKKLVFLLLLIIAGLVVFMYMRGYLSAPAVEEVASTDVYDATFVIEGKEFVLKDGTSALPAAPGSATLETVTIFGDPARADFDSDGDDDAAVLLVRDGGGSGVFYYAALALFDGNEYKATNVLYLGDRIAPQNINVQEGRAVFNFAERAVGESMTTVPSVGTSVWIDLDPINQHIAPWERGVEGPSDYTEKFAAQVDRVSVVFEHRDYTMYKLTTNGVVREGDLNTERGFEDDPDATVYVLNWTAPEAEQMYYVRLTKEPTKLYMLDTERQLMETGALIKVQ